MVRQEPPTTSSIRSPTRGSSIEIGSPLQSALFLVDLHPRFQDFTYSIPPDVRSLTFAFASTDYPEVIGIDSVQIIGDLLLEPFSFSGFYRPIENDPAVNKVRAGAAVPVKFSLNGDQGLDIFQTGYPGSQAIACDSFATIVPIVETASAGQSRLRSSTSLDQYTYVWKTERSWDRTCRQLVFRFLDGSFHIANFKFD